MKIACVLITHLPMKAELKRSATLKGKPVIIIEGSDSKPVVLDSSPQAKGVVAGMPLQEALSRCKGATLVRADRPYYRSVFDTAVESLCQRSPLVEISGEGCVYVGLSGLEKMYGGESNLIAALFRAVPDGLGPRIGVAEGKFPAYVAAIASPGGRATRVPDDAASFMRPLSVDLLPISWEDKSRLHGFGIQTLGDLARQPISAIQAQFGKDGAVAWSLAGGVDRSPLIAYRVEEVVTEYLSFPSPTTTLSFILVALETLLGRAFSHPMLRNRYARMAVVESSVLLNPPWTRQFVFKDPVSRKDRAFYAMRGSMEATALPGPVEDMRLTLSGFTGEFGIQSSFLSDVRKQEQLREMMSQLEKRLRRKPPIFQVRNVEPWSRIPERRQALVQFVP